VALDYRHVIDHLLRKPGAFERYRYREQLFPSSTFRRAYDHLACQHGQRSGAVEYLRLLKLASEVGESGVELMLIDYLSPPGSAWSVDLFRRTLQPEPRPCIELQQLEPEWSSYDSLLSVEPEVAHAG
jgi:hypothetical protein